jgi:hypothetical protein
MTDRLIREYLQELRRELTLPTRQRERVLTEAADHLQLAAEHLDPQGAGSPEDAQRAATARFGSPREVARRFAEELATDGAYRATRVVSVATIAFCIVFGLSGPARSVAAVWAPFAVQIAFVCAALSFVRCVRHRDERAVSAGKLRWILRGDEIALGVILVSIGVEAIGAAAGHPARAWHTSTVMVSIGVALLAVLALGRVVVGHARLRSLDGFGDGDVREQPDELADDLVALVGQARTWARWHPWLAEPAGVLEHAVRGIRVPRQLTRWLDLRAHPWRVGLIVALAAGACAGGGHALLEHPGSLSQLPGALAAFTVIAGVEAVVVSICFAVLGPFLGLRRPVRDRRITATPR